MNSRQLVAALLVAASCALAACSSDAAAPPSSPASTPTTDSASSSSSSSAESSADKGTTDIASDPGSTTAAPSGPQQCAQQRDITIKIVLGDIDCTTAYGVAFRVDRQGDKRQSVAGYVCEFGNATIRPTIFTCTNPTSGAEFAVDET